MSPVRSVISMSFKKSTMRWRKPHQPAWKTTTHWQSPLCWRSAISGKVQHHHGPAITVLGSFVLFLCSSLHVSLLCSGVPAWFSSNTCPVSASLSPPSVTLGLSAPFPLPCYFTSFRSHLPFFPCTSSPRPHAVNNDKQVETGQKRCIQLYRFFMGHQNCLF